MKKHRKTDINIMNKGGVYLKQIDDDNEKYIGLNKNSKTDNIIDNSKDKNIKNRYKKKNIDSENKKRK